jgi:SecD/SecF fusion protein
MRHLVRNSMLVLALLILAAASIYPPSEKLRQGKDLRGGFSLVYQLQIASQDNAGDVMNSTIAVLKDRIDPQGLLEISIVPQGRDRIEITMPLPSESVKALRSEYLSMFDAIEAEEITGRDFDRAMSASAAERSGAIGAMARGDADRLDILRRASDAVERERDATVRLEMAVDGGAPAEAIDEIAAEAAGAGIEVQRLREELLGTVLDTESLRSALELSAEPHFVLDEGDAEPFRIPSPREEAIRRLKTAHPDKVETIDAVIAKAEEYESKRTTLDDPSDLIRLLQGSGVLEFRIAPKLGEHPEESSLRRQLRESGPRAASTVDAGWFAVADPTAWVQRRAQAEALVADASAYFASQDFVVEPYEGRLYMLLYSSIDKSILQDRGRGQWRVSRSFETADDTGRPAVGFEMDPNGAVLLGQLTESNTGERMAVLLDNRVITAPNLISKITAQGQITGINSAIERRNIIRTLNAGTLSASLSPRPIGQSVLGPELGQDNLDSGLLAGAIALVIVSVFMIVYYYSSGAVAVVALFCNALLLVAMLALGRAALTLPGIAGIVLTFGMAVDANVLIYERVREELRRGIPVKAAVRLGFDKAMSSIVDGNVTNLIVCLVLANIGTQEIKGFAITLGIGVISTLFCALVISRLLIAILIDKVGVKTLGALPLTIPAIDRLLEPKIDWMKYRFVFIVVSLCYVGLGIGMIVYQGPLMLDNEFRGGTAATMVFKSPMTRPAVQERVNAIAAAAPAGTTLESLRTAEVLAVDPEADGVTSQTFRVKTVITDRDAVSAALQEAFADVLPTKPPLTFAGQDEPESRRAPVFPITEPSLGRVIDRPGIVADISGYDGGVAIVLDGLDPAPTLDDLRERLEFMRRDRAFSDYLARSWEVILLDGDPSAVRAAALVVADPGLSLYDSQDRWQAEIADVEWRLASTALLRTEALAGVDSFDAAVAASFRARAVAAVFLSLLLITIYIWVRFGSIRYSSAAIVTLLHDVLTAIGLIALAEIVYDFPATASAARAIGVLPFKIDLSVVAAMLTIIGYSLNDTIIVMDRIRENRGKLDYASRRIINLSINQTISRTTITSGTTLLAVLVLFIVGGEGVRAFSFALLVGILVGTYSSIAVAAPLVWSRKHDAGTEGVPAGAAPTPA